MNATTPRGIRLNNPLCIRRDSTVYVGEVTPSSDPDFKQFEDPKWGLRAGVRILQTYWARDGIKTVGQAIARWSPPSENPTAAYVQNVCAACLVDADAPVTVQTVLRPMIKAMATQEDGYWAYSDELLEQAIELAEAA